MVNCKTFKLNDIYDVDFNKIKEQINIKYNNCKIEDFGSIILVTLRKPNMAFSINQICKVEMFIADSNITTGFIEQIKNDLEYIINLQIDDACLVEK